ncbi:hypothetical protein D3C73_1307190 [compost metagenome]
MLKNSIRSCGKRCRKRRVVSRPLMPGRPKSMITRCGTLSWTRINASSPVAASRTSIAGNSARNRLE